MAYENYSSQIYQNLFAARLRLLARLLNFQRLHRHEPVFGIIQQFVFADLHRAILHHADLGNANLSGADFSGADLEEANLNGAVLRGANLTGANLLCAAIEQTVWDGALLDRTCKAGTPLSL